MRIKVISSVASRKYLQIGNYGFSQEIPLNEADALLCEWSPAPELLTFDKPKVWYCCEATSRELFKTTEWQYYRNYLRSDQFLFHSHPDERYRVPHITYISETRQYTNIERNYGTIAVVSNYANYTGLPFWLKSDLQKRTRLILSPAVALFGKRNAWQKHKLYPFSPPALPSNYVCEIPGLWTHADKLLKMSQYRSAVCMENTHEPYYFTEKFVDAVQAGCIPIYQAHPTVAKTFLENAFWIDPARFNFDTKKILCHIKSLSISECVNKNFTWLDTDQVKQTSLESVFLRIGNILAQQAI
jgi:hypothetical protein